MITPSPTTAPTLPRWFTPPSAGEILRVTPETVIGWIRRGELRAVNLAQHGTKRPRYRIDPVDLERFLKGREVIQPVATRTQRQQIGTYY